MRIPPQAHTLFLLPGMVALLAGLWGGLHRLGWQLEPLTPTLAVAHGPLMVSGFLGTVICLERAVGLGDWRGYFVPALAGVGGIALALGQLSLGMGAITLASLLLVVLYGVVLARRAESFTTILLFGAASWGMGNLLWLADWPIFRVFPWWIGFLVLTIAGERLELSRFLKPTPGSRAAFYVIIGLLMGGMVLSLWSADGGGRLLGASLVTLAAWLVRFDVARRTLRSPGLPRYVASCLLSGYFWLAVGGLLALAHGSPLPGPVYDALLHSVFLGFVLAMIFGHAPIIVPAVLRVQIPFHPAFYLHLGLLHLTLGVRVAGDLLPGVAGRLAGGTLNGVVILLFIGNMLLAVGRGPRRVIPAPRER